MMPNLALLFGAIGVLAAGIYVLYNDGVFSNFHQYEHEPRIPRYNPPARRRSPSPVRRRRREEELRRAIEDVHREIEVVRREEEDLNCAICCDSVSVPHPVNGPSITLNCDHRFHRRCIQNWILRSNEGDGPTCPNCRSVIRDHQSIMRSSPIHYMLNM